MPKKKSYLTVTDQFCGAGGSSLGAAASGTSVDGIPVEPMANVLPSHLWLVFGDGA